MFVNRKRELGFLNNLLTRKYPGPAQLALLYGRRRVGKSELLLQWVTQSGLPYTYWAAEKMSAAMQRQHFYSRLLSVPIDTAPVYRSWTALWEAAVRLLEDQQRIIIMDELPYVAEADSSTLSAFQNAWDQYFQRSSLTIVLCGSHVRVMENLRSQQSPLFGRMTAQWHLMPLPFFALAEFFPNWTAEERVALYAIVGGVPAYLRWLDPTLHLEDNIRQIVLDPGNMFLAEPSFLLNDEVREPGNYRSIIQAIGEGNHTVNDISNRTVIPRTSLMVYLQTLQQIYLVERRLPVTLHEVERDRSRRGRYYLTDHYFRFYYRFLAPFTENPPVDPDQVIIEVRANLRGFVGATVFEELARQWVALQGKSGKLPFNPERIGSHWGGKVQVDVVAINFKTRHIMLGECKWGADLVDRQVIREMLDRKTPLTLASLPEDGKGWHVSYAFFARAGFTEAARREAQAVGAFLVDLDELDRALMAESVV
jgi:AAA+ ATPase superfamily predicted ATPase